MCGALLDNCFYRVRSVGRFVSVILFLKKKKKKRNVFSFSLSALAIVCTFNYHCLSLCWWTQEEHLFSVVLIAGPLVVEQTGERERAEGKEQVTARVKKQDKRRRRTTTISSRPSYPCSEDRSLLRFFFTHSVALPAGHFLIAFFFLKNEIKKDRTYAKDLADGWYSHEKMGKLSDGNKLKLFFFANDPTRKT